MLRPVTSLLPTWPDCLPTTKLSTIGPQPLQQTVPANSEHKNINAIYSCHTHKNSSNSANTSHYKTNLPKRKYQVRLWLGNALFSHTLEHLQCAPHRAHSWGYREWRITPTPKRSVGSLSSVRGSRIYHQLCCDSLLWSECLCPPPHKIICWKLMPSVMVLRGRAFRRGLGHEGAAPRMSLVPLGERDLRELASPPREDTDRRCHLWTRKQTTTIH